MRDQIWFKEYLAQFPFVPFMTPEELGDDFDRDLLEKLVIGSFSSDYELKFDTEQKENELYIAVKS